MNNMRQIILFLLSAFLFLGCATAKSYKKPGVDFSQYKDCAVVQFDCIYNPSIGQEVADTIALEFIRKGFNAIERSQLRAIVEEEKLRQISLTESTKETLLLSGINAIVVGSVGSYHCVPAQQPIFFMGALLGVMSTNNCHASISLKMLDVRTGDVLWAANGSHSLNAVGMTANKVLQEVLDKLSKQIPTP